MIELKLENLEEMEAPLLSQDFVEGFMIGLGGAAAGAGIVLGIMALT